MSVKLNLLKNTGANIWVKSTIVIFRLVQVPLLISYLGVDDFGRWLILSSLPTWLALADLGFGMASANEIAMSTAAGDLKNARSIFSTNLVLIIFIALICSCILFVTIPFVPIENLLHLPVERHTELVWAVIWLSLSIFSSFAGEVFSSRFRAARQTHTGGFLYGFLPLLDLSAMFIALKFNTRFDTIALSLLLSHLLYLAVAKWWSFRVMPTLVFSSKDVNFKTFGPLIRKGLSFTAFPLGNGLLYQASLLIVQSILGPAAVALFGTARALVRTVNQSMEVINYIVWPELSHLIGLKDFKNAAKLHRGAVGISIILSSLGVLFLAIFGQQLYSLWTGKSINLPYFLLLIFLLPIPFNAFWFTSSVVHLASNQHEGLAIRYLIAACLSSILCIVLSHFQGIEGAAVSTLIVDLILIPYVLKHSLKITQDNWKDFFPGIIYELKSLPKLLQRKKNKSLV